MGIVSAGLKFVTGTAKVAGKAVKTGVGMTAAGIGGALLASDKSSSPAGKPGIARRVGGAFVGAVEEATLGQLGSVGKAVGAGLRSYGKKGDTRGGSGVDTKELKATKISGDDVVGAVNKSTQQIMGGLNNLNTTFGRVGNKYWGLLLQQVKIR
jgi:hypothetical protein